MQKSTLVLEGIPASGKTSLANYLRDFFGATKVNESLGVPSKNSGDQQAIFLETLERYARAKSGSGCVVIDRGYPSLLAWDYCREQSGTPLQYSEKLKWIRRALKAEALFEPTWYVYLQGNVETSFSRRPRERKLSDAWSDVQGVQHCLDFYEKFFSEPRRRKHTLRYDCRRPTVEIATDVFRRLISG